MAYNIFLIGIAITVIINAALLLWKLKNSLDKQTTRWIISFNLIVLLTLFSGLYLLTVILQQATITLLYLIYVSIFTTGITFYINRKVQYSEFIEETVRKITLPSKLKPTKSYMIKEVQKHRAYKLFQDSIAQGLSGLLITRQNPKNITQKYKLKKAKIRWLTELDKKRSLDPTDLEEIQYLLNNFIEHSKDPIILFDGIDYLADYNSFNKLLHLFRIMKDKISIKKAILILYINPKLLKDRDIKLLEAEFKKI